MADMARKPVFGAWLEGARRGAVLAPRQAKKPPPGVRDIYTAPATHPATRTTAQGKGATSDISPAISTSIFTHRDWVIAGDRGRYTSGPWAGVRAYTWCSPHPNAKQPPSPAPTAYHTRWVPGRGAFLISRAISCNLAILGGSV